jgi:hypothetical protein
MFSTTHSNVRRIACLGLGVGIFLTGSAIAAGQAHASTLPTSYEVHIANTQPNRLVLQGESATTGHWVFKPPKYIDGRSSAVFEVAAANAPGGAQASVTYLDPVTHTTVTFSGDAAPYRNGSTSSAVTYGGGLYVSGYQGFFTGLHPQLNLHYAVTGVS